ncbi:thiamine phosphate synthase [Cellulomonas persica]|uniref:Thiamine-phosphate synthase n=1 Tax=Cellulomonas persica TaxID=76861 RepID=A0A510V232_9CELL|nr:thiamine phosphate synthase [Cellulomonas persica]GEK19165.1 thiamine-phosphate synthase [Cellulomonas persica]
MTGGAGGRASLPPGPYLVVDAAVCAAVGRRPADLAAAAVRSGVRTVQVRAKHVGVRELVDLTVAVTDAVRLAGPALVLVDDRVDVALAARARGAGVDGVHLGQSDLEAGDARALLGPGALIGVSAARPQDVRAVDPAVVDYIGTGPVRLTRTKPEAAVAAGFDGLGEAARTSVLPVVAIGGLGLDDVPAVRRAGARGLAVVSAICAAADPARAARMLVEAWQQQPSGMSGPSRAGVA